MDNERKSNFHLVVRDNGDDVVSNVRFDKSFGLKPGEGDMFRFEDLFMKRILIKYL